MGIHYKVGMIPERGTILFSKESISARIDELASLISRDYRGKDLILIGILKGSFVFLADLIRRLDVPVQIDFVRLASYGSAMESSREVRIAKDIEIPIEGRDVLVVEDIVDSGITLAFLLERLRSQHPRSLKCCVLIDKKERREVNVTLDYTGFSLDRGFIVGYGLDWAERYRSLPEIFIINP